jgi:hypothetical protein
MSRAKLTDSWIRPAIAQGRELPRNHQHEVGIGLDVEECAQLVDGATFDGHGQGTHAPRSPEPHRGPFDYAPSVGIDFNGTPCVVGESCCR